LRTALTGAAMLCASVGAFPTTSHALFNGDFIIGSTNFGFACPATGCGTVTISGDGTTDITIDLAITVAQLQIHGIGETLAFNVSDSPDVTYKTGTTFPAFWSTTLQTSGVGQQDGFGSFNDAINCPNSNISGNLCGTEVKFDLTSLSNLFLSASGEFLMAVKLAGTNADGTAINGFTGFGGIVAVPGPVVGAGFPGVIAACGALLALARRRRQLAA
jgi:hypothetical protein